MDIVSTIILSIVEGITEFLPISSTGHLILVDALLKISATEFVKSFNIAIQLGAILAVVVLYAKTLISDRRLLIKVIVAFLPTAIIGLIFYKLIKQFLLGNTAVVIWTLALGGLALIVFEFWQARRARAWKERGETSIDLTNLSYKQAVIIGLCQSLAVIPGVSRSAATIVGGLALGLSRRAIVEFSFLLAIPTMLAATVLDLAKNGASFSGQEFGLLTLGFIVSFIVALVTVKLLLGYVKRYNFIPFGVYRLVLAIVAWVILF
jgi:undecaprenyl-diphosphatase